MDPQRWFGEAIRYVLVFNHFILTANITCPVFMSIDAICDTMIKTLSKNIYTKILCFFLTSVVKSKLLISDICSIRTDNTHGTSVQRVGANIKHMHFQRNDLCARSRYQGQGQITTPSSICGM